MCATVPVPLQWERGEQHNLLGYSEQRLRDFFAQLDEPEWRARQLLPWIHQHYSDGFTGMTNLSKGLRASLDSIAAITAPEISARSVSDDGTLKWLMRTGNSQIETVMIPEGTRRTLCVSSQAGCALDCQFCATGRQGYERNLTSAEIIGQLWLVQRELARVGETVTNVVMMGMGEPLLNFDAVVEALSLMTADLAYGLSKRRVTLSTAGVVPGIDRLAGVCDVALAISLHAPDDSLRSELVPLNRRYPIAGLLAAARRYLQVSPGQRHITVEYILIAGVNDALVQARALAKLLRETPCKINLIPCNQVPGVDFTPPSAERQQAFCDLLSGSGYVVTLRRPRGRDIAAACGQLAGQVQDRTRRQQQYRVER